MGCKGSKNVAQPKAVAGANPPAAVGTAEKAGETPLKHAQTPNKSIASPSKSPMKGLKTIPVNELQKYKVADIMGFVKLGNLAMVSGLVNYHRLGRGVVLIRG